MGLLCFISFEDNSCVPNIHSLNQRFFLPPFLALTSLEKHSVGSYSYTVLYFYKYLYPTSQVVSSAKIVASLSMMVGRFMVALSLID